MTEYYPRDMADAVKTALENMPVVAVTGMRQTGMTAFLKSEPELLDRVSNSPQGDREETFQA
jgi:hypothetical protein